MEHLLIYNPKRHKFDLLQMIFDGVKTAELKMYLHKSPPYECLSKGDLLYIKVSGGPIVGSVQISHVEQYELAKKETDFLLKLLLRVWEDVGYRNEEHAFNTFEKKRYARYATFFKFATPRKFKNPIFIEKHDRRAFIKNFKLSMYSNELSI